MTAIKIGIYTIYSKHHNKVMYVGQSTDTDYRWENGHKKPLRNGKHENKLLQEDFNKFEEDNFVWSIVEECPIEELDRRELYWEKHYGTYNPTGEPDKGYNRTWGASPPVHRGPKSEETKKRMKESWTPARRDEQSEVMKGRLVVQKTRDKMSAANKGKKNPMYGRVGEKNPMYGRVGEKHPMYGKRHPKAVLDRISAAHKGKNNPMFGKTGEKSPRSKLTNDQREMIIQLREQDLKHWTQQRLGEEFGVGQTTVWHILHPSRSEEKEKKE